MITILKTADFSANNIGQIEVPAIISDFTKAAILASGNESLTNSQKVAIDDFFTEIGALDNTGVFAKLNKLYIPVIGGTVAKSLLNYKNNNVDAVLDPEGFDYEKGLKGNGSATSSMATVQSSYNLNLTDLSFVIREKASSLSTYNNRCIFLMYGTGTTFRSIEQRGGSGSFNIKANDTNSRNLQIYSQSSGTTNNGHAVITSLTGQSGFYYDKGGKHDVTTTFVSHSTSSSLRMFVEAVSSTKSNGIIPPISFIALGTALPESEAILLYNSIEKMMVEFD